MSEQRKVGSVTYQEVGEEYFKQRGLRRHAGMWSLWALGVGRRHLRRVLRLELRSGHRRVRRPAHRIRAHGGHVLRPRLLDRRDVPGTPTHGRGILVRTFGDGSVGRVPDGLGREHGVRDHAGRRRRGDRLADAGDHGGSVQHHRQPVVEQPAVLVGGLLHHLRRDQHHRDRGHDAVHGDDHDACPSPSSCSSSSRRSSPGSSTSRCGRTSRRAESRSPEGVVRGSPSASAGSSSPSRSRSGSSSRSRRCRSPPRSRWIPRRDVPRGSMLAMHTLLIAAILTLVFNTALPGGAALYGAVGVPAPGRPVRDLRQGERHRAARVAVRDRTGGELLHDHLRVRPEHLLAVPCRVFPEVPVEDARDAEDAARRVDRRSARRLRGLVPRVPPPAEGAGHADRGGAAEYGGVRGGDLLHHADDVVRHAPPEHAEHRAALPEQVGGPRGGHRRRPRRDLARSRSS